MTSSRRSMQKSTSKSGMLTRSGLRKRSKSRLYGMGSRSVIRIAYATIDLGLEPRLVPGLLDLRALRPELDEAPLQPFARDVTKIRGRVVPRGDLEVGQ